MKKRYGTTRRDFLKTATAAAFGAPYIITSTMRRAGAAPANDRIVMGMIGPGKQGLGLMKKFMRFPDTQMVAVCDVSTARREYAKKQAENRYAEEMGKGTYKGCEAYGDFRELLARKDIDAVIVATPDHWHTIINMTACNEKKDIYCEKPLTLTIHEAKMMIEAVRNNDRVFQTGSQQRSEHNGRFHKACELVRNGRIGKVQKVLVNIGGPSKPCDLPGEPTPTGLDWNFWLGPAPMRDYHHVICPAGIPEQPPEDQRDKIAWYSNFPSWRNYREYSGGGMTDWGAHHFDIAQWGLGMDESGPVRIVPPRNGEPLTYVYDNGVIMQKVGGVDGVKFIGTDGWVEVNRGTFKCEPETIDDEPIPEDGVHLYKAENGDHKLDFVNCIKSRRRPICDVEIGARSVTVCHLGNLALWNDEILFWDPKNWRFEAPAKANDWLEREKRAPWKLPEV